MSIMVSLVFVKQRTVNCDCQPHFADKQIHHGVPLGTVLWSILFILYVQLLSNPIKRHSLSVHLFDDDIQIKTSILPQHVHSAISDVKYWMTENKLQLNDEKTKCLLIRPNKCTKNLN